MATETKTEGAAATTTEAGGSLLEEILAETKLRPNDDGYDVARRGVQAFIAELISNKSQERIDKAVVDAMVAEIDARLSSQVNEILHHPDFQRLESAWRGLKFTIDRVDFRE